MTAALVGAVITDGVPVFGRDCYGGWQIEAVGADWVVARSIDDPGQMGFASGAPLDALVAGVELVTRSEWPDWEQNRDEQRSR